MAFEMAQNDCSNLDHLIAHLYKIFYFGHLSQICRILFTMNIKSFYLKNDVNDYQAQKFNRFPYKLIFVILDLSFIKFH